MVKVLLANNGDKVVGYASIPDFHPPPEVLQWGSRFFVYQGITLYDEAGKAAPARPSSGDAVVYREGLCYPLLGPVTAIPEPDQPETPPGANSFLCPRRSNVAAPFDPAPGPDYWMGNDTCSYCGGWNAEKVLEAVRTGKTVTPTDKDYKLYVEGKKAYFQHFTQAHRDEFRDLLNAQKITCEFPGYFYTAPYFLRLIQDAQAGIERPDPTPEV